MRRYHDKHLEQPTFGTYVKVIGVSGYLYAPRSDTDGIPWLSTGTGNRFEHADIWGRINASHDSIYIEYDPRIDFEDGE